MGLNMIKSTKNNQEIKVGTEFGTEMFNLETKERCTDERFKLGKVLGRGGFGIVY